LSATALTGILKQWLGQAPKLQPDPPQGQGLGDIWLVFPG
jgi:hypothetical protein